MKKIQLTREQQAERLLLASYRANRAKTRLYLLPLQLYRAANRKSRLRCLAESAAEKLGPMVWFLVPPRLKRPIARKIAGAKLWLGRLLQRPRLRRCLQWLWFLPVTISRLLRLMMICTGLLLVLWFLGVAEFLRHRLASSRASSNGSRRSPS